MTLDLVPIGGSARIVAVDWAQLADEEGRRLRALGMLIKPPGAGLLIRTEAEGVAEEGRRLRALGIDEGPRSRWPIAACSADAIRSP